MLSQEQWVLDNISVEIYCSAVVQLLMESEMTNTPHSILCIAYSSTKYCFLNFSVSSHVDYDMIL